MYTTRARLIRGFGRDRRYRDKKEPDQEEIGAESSCASLFGAGGHDLRRSGLLVWTEDGRDVPVVSYAPRVRGAVRGALGEELLDFVSWLRSDGAPDCSGLAEARHGVATILALVQSARDGRDVAVVEKD